MSCTVMRSQPSLVRIVRVQCLRQRPCVRVGLYVAPTRSGRNAWLQTAPMEGSAAGFRLPGAEGCLSHARGAHVRCSNTGRTGCQHQPAERTLFEHAAMHKHTAPSCLRVCQPFPVLHLLPRGLHSLTATRKTAGGERLRGSLGPRCTMLRGEHNWRPGRGGGTQAVAWLGTMPGGRRYRCLDRRKCPWQIRGRAAGLVQPRYLSHSVGVEVRMRRRRPSSRDTRAALEAEQLRGCPGISTTRHR